MSAELAIRTDGEVAFAFGGGMKREAVWHRQGTEIAADATRDDWLRAAGLDWQVSTEPVFVRRGDAYVPVDQFRALMRDNGHVFDMVGHEWEPIQNWQAMEFFEQWCRDAKAELRTAGALRDGRDVWVMARLNGGFSLPGGEDVESNVLFDNPHQRGRAALIIPTKIDVVCANTHGWALSAHEGKQRKLEARFTHVGSGRYSKESALMQLGIIEGDFELYRQHAEFLVSKRVDDDTFDGYIADVYRLTDLPASVPEPLRERRSRHNERVLEGLRSILNTQPQAMLPSAGTWWAAYSAVTFDVDHSPRRRLSDDAALGSAWLGAGADRKTRALEVAIEMANAS